MADEKDLNVTEEPTVEEPNKTDREISEETRKKIQKQVDSKQAKQQKLGIYRIGEYLREEHKWENYVFLLLAIFVLVLGMLILNGALSVSDSFPILGGHGTLVGTILSIVGGLFVLYGLWPFVKPALPELKKITWLDRKSFIGNIIRTFLFIIIFVALFVLYDYLITGILARIF